MGSNEDHDAGQRPSGRRVQFSGVGENVDENIEDADINMEGVVGGAGKHEQPGEGPGGDYMDANVVTEVRLAEVWLMNVPLLTRDAIATIATEMRARDTISSTSEKPLWLERLEPHFTRLRAVTTVELVPIIAPPSSGRVPRCSQHNRNGAVDQ